MVPHSHSSAPSLDIGVQNRLRRLDRGLLLTFHPFQINVLTGEVIEMEGALDPETGERRRGPLHAPEWYLWQREACGYRFIQSYPAETGFGHPEVFRLETDLARTMTADQIVRAMRHHDEERKQRDRMEHDAFRRDVADANESRVHDLVFEGKTGYREARPFSYPGQQSRTSSGERGLVLEDARHDGWEHPE